jgi:hypothetical protein
MNETAILKKHKHRPTVRATDRQVERLRQQSALLHAEIHTSGAFHLIIDPALALDITQALNDWVKLNEKQLEQGVAEEEFEHKNLQTVRMRLALRDFELAVEAASRAGEESHVQNNEGRVGSLQRADSREQEHSAGAQPTDVTDTTCEPDPSVETRHAARYTIPLYGRR